MSHLEPELLSAFVDDAVTADERTRIEVHLPACADCRAQLDAFGFVRASARTLDRPAIPEIHRKQLWREINRTRRAPANRWRAMIAVAGTAAAIAAFAGLTMLGTTGSTVAPMQGLAVEHLDAIAPADLDVLLASNAQAMTTAGGQYEADLGDDAADDTTALPEAAPPAGPATLNQRTQSSSSDDTNHGAQIAGCEGAIRPGGDGGAIAIRYIVTRYQGTDVYVLVYDIPRENPTHREVFVVSRAECRVLTHRSSV
jgi:hypothetical protein